MRRDRADGMDKGSGMWATSEQKVAALDSLIDLFIDPDSSGHAAPNTVHL